MTRPSPRASGFTLIELAMVLLIVMLLIGGLLMPLTAQNEIRGRQETDRALANIRDALIGFAVINGRLPCPAPASLATGATGAGLEATTAVAGTTTTTGPCGCTAATSGIASAGGPACNDTTPGSVTGVLPWATLGLSETDAWSNRYTYRVTTRFARLASGQTDFGCALTSAPTATAFAICSAGDMSVQTAATGGAAIATAVPAIVVSHGKNGYGAYQSTGIQIATPADQTTSDPQRDAYVNRLLRDQRENSDSATNTLFVSNTDMDDQLIWLPTSILMGRMLSAGKLP